jgi:hypothetical protein
MTVADDIYTNLDRMIDLCRRKIDTMQKLKNLLRIAELVGVPPKELNDRVRTSVRDADNRTIQPWRGYVLSIRVGDGPEQDYKLTDVHLDLWPQDLREQYETHKARQRRRTENV